MAPEEILLDARGLRLAALRWGIVTAVAATFPERVSALALLSAVRAPSIQAFMAELPAR